MRLHCRSSVGRQVPKVSWRRPCLAEDIGFSDVWLNDHIGFASNTEHPSPRMFDPLSSMAIAAAVTTTIGIGSQITAAYYPPILYQSSVEMTRCGIPKLG